MLQVSPWRVRAEGQSGRHGRECVVFSGYKCEHCQDWGESVKELKKYLQFLSRICRYCASDLFRYACPVCIDFFYICRLPKFLTDNSHSGLD